MINRHACNSILRIFGVGTFPWWAMACSTETTHPGSNQANTEATTGVSSATSAAVAGPTTGGVATSSQTSGGAATVGMGGASLASVSNAATTAPMTGTASSGGTSTSTSTSGASGGGSDGTGTTVAGAGGTSTTAGAGGTSSAPPGDPDPSPGCGTAAPTECAPCMTSGRPYYVDMPANYDPDRPYPVVFKYHPLGGSASGARNMYLGSSDFEAIYVSQDGSDNGFPNQGGADEQMTREIMDDIEARLCVDRARYYATGFSYGGSMSFTAACNMSDKFRAIASMAGAPISGARCTSEAPERPVAILAIHGEEDTALPITMGEPMVEALIARNGCSADAPQPSDIIDPECVRMESALEAGAYQGCMEGYPVIWCPIPGYPHNMPTWSRGAIAEFFSQF